MSRELLSDRISVWQASLAHFGWMKLVAEQMKRPDKVAFGRDELRGGHGNRGRNSFIRHAPVYIFAKKITWKLLF